MKKGFVLMETIVVIVVISVSLLAIFSSYNKILVKVKKENKYDTSEYVYLTKYIRDYFKKNYSSISSDDINISLVNDYSSYVPSFLNVKRIHIIKNINSLGGNEKKFDAYMIDYLRKLDVGDSDELIVIEYKRPSLKSDGNQRIDTNNESLYETYIASLEW